MRNFLFQRNSSPRPRIREARRTISSSSSSTTSRLLNKTFSLRLSEFYSICMNKTPKKTLVIRLSASGIREYDMPDMRVTDRQTDRQPTSQPASQTEGRADKKNERVSIVLYTSTVVELEKRETILKRTERFRELRLVVTTSGVNTVSHHTPIPLTSLLSASSRSVSRRRRREK